MPAPPRPTKLLDQNAELAARLKVSEESLRQLREAHEQLQVQHRQTLERKGLLEEEVRWLKGQLYGRSSERLTGSDVSPDQKMLFNEAEVLAAIEAAEAAEDERTTIIAAHERKARPHSGGREPIPAHLPRKEILHDPQAHEKWCTHEHEGVCWARERIGEEISERYHFEPAKVWVERHVYPKYACRHCHQGVTVAAAVKNILPKSNASASLLAHVVTSKFDDGLPIFRICRQLERQEVRLTPGTVGTWVNTVGAETVMPLINLMADDLLAEPVVQMDETYLQVLQSEKAPSSEHYMVVRAAGPPGRRIVLFTHVLSRTAAALKDLLIGSDGPFRGKLLTDGLELYDIVTESLGLKHFGCLQHYPESAVIRRESEASLHFWQRGLAGVRIRSQRHPHRVSHVLWSGDHAFRWSLEMSDATLEQQSVSLERCQTHVASEPQCDAPVGEGLPAVGRSLCQILQQMHARSTRRVNRAGCGAVCAVVANAGQSSTRATEGLDNCIARSFTRLGICTLDVGRVHAAVADRGVHSGRRSSVAAFRGLPAHCPRQPRRYDQQEDQAADRV